MNSFERLLFHTSMNSGDWPRAFLLLNPHEGKATSLSRHGLSIDPLCVGLRSSAADARILLPVAHAVIGHAQDRKTLADDGADDYTLRTFDIFADAIARLTAELGGHDRVKQSDVAEKYSLLDDIRQAVTLRDLSGTALKRVRMLDHKTCVELATDRIAHPPPEAPIPSELLYSPRIRSGRGFSGSDVMEIPIDGISERLGGLAAPYVDVNKAQTARDICDSMTPLHDAACDVLRGIDRIDHGAGWVGLLMEAAYSKLSIAPGADLLDEVKSTRSYLRYRAILDEECLIP